MRLKKHLNEIKRLTEREREVIIPKIIENIKKDCAPFLKDIEKIHKFIYRGNNRRVPYIRTYTPREDRIPKDMPDELHKKFDEEFYKKFRWKPRGSGVFTTFKKSVAEGYGQAHLFFPIGNYKYVWSPVIEDLYSEIEGTDLSYYGDEEGMEYLEDNYDEIYGPGGDGSWWYKGEDTEKKDENVAIKIALEIEKENMGDDEEEDPSFYIDEDQLEWIPDISYEDFIEEKVEEMEMEMENEIDKLMKTYIDKDLQKASKTSNEIVFQCRKYYLVNVLYELDIFKELF